MIIESIKKQKNVNENVVEKISHSEYKDVCFYQNFLRYSMSRIRIQHQDHRVGNYEISKISLSWFDNKMCI